MTTATVSGPAELDLARLRSTLASRLRELRVARSMSLNELKSRIGEDISIASLHNYETGKSPITVERLQLLCRFYGVPVSAVCDDGSRLMRGTICEEQVALFSHPHFVAFCERLLTMETERRTKVLAIVSELLKLES